MKGYKIYLTKSREVAEIIYRAMTNKVNEKKEITGVRMGCAYGIEPELMPEMYRTIDYNYCLVEYDLEHPMYEIVFG